MWPTLLKHFYIRATMDLFEVKASYFSSFISLSVHTPICEVPLPCVPKAFKRIFRPEMDLLFSPPHFLTDLYVSFVCGTQAVMNVRMSKRLFFIEVNGDHGCQGKIFRE